MGFFNVSKKQDLPLPSSPTPTYEKRYLEAVLNQWLNSAERKEQFVADDYYDGKHDILNREKKVIGSDGNLVPIHNVANNKLVDNQYKKLVDQKTNFALGKPLTIATGNLEYLKHLENIFDARMHRKLRMLARHSVNGGIAWLYPYYNSEGEFKVELFPAEEVCAVWKDSLHTELEFAMRYYSVNVYGENSVTTKVNYVDVYTKEGIYHYRHQGASLIEDVNPHSYYMYIGENGYNWTRLPLIPFKYNSDETPLIRMVKCLQDALNQVLSDFQNNMEEDPRTSILVLKNYDGTNLADFRHNLAIYGAIKVTTVDGVQGGVETLKVEVNAANYQAILMQLKRALVENGRGFDAKEERMDGDPNQMNIESMYTDIDLDVNAMESEYQAGFEELKWFIDMYLKQQGKGDFTEEKVEFIFNRDIFINEDAKIQNCVVSSGIVSTKTILAHHPWVTNLERELAQLEEDKQAEMDEMEAINAFKKPQNKVGGSE